jgi:glycosyltransferase involved in cell wall biosynthesis
LTPILFLASDLVPSSDSRHIARIAGGLDCDRFRVEVRRGSLRNALDWSGVRALKHMAAEMKPAIIHAWGPAAVRASFAIASPCADGGHIPRLVISDSSFMPADWSHWLSRRRLRSCDRVVPTTWVEAERYRSRGVPMDRLTRIAPGVLPAPAFDRAKLLASLDIPANGRFIVTSGKLDHDSGMKLAVWAFDLIRKEFPDLHLVIVGDGPARAAIDAYARSTMYDDFRVRFAGLRADGASVIAAADFAWMVQPRGDVRFALEAMSAGVPVFAWGIPEMAELIDDGSTGLLVDAGQPAQLAKKTYPFIRDDAARIAIGKAGRAAALERFPATKEIEHFELLYGELA